MRYVKKNRRNYIVDAVQVTRGEYSEVDTLLLNNAASKILRENDSSISVLIGGASCCVFPGDYIVIIGDVVIGVVKQEVFEKEFEPSKETLIGNSTFYVEDLFIGRGEIEFYMKPESNLTYTMHDDICIFLHDVKPHKILQLIPGGPTNIQLLRELTIDEYRKMYALRMKNITHVHYSLALDIFNQVTILNNAVKKLNKMIKLCNTSAFFDSYAAVGIKKVDATEKEKEEDNNE